VLFAARSRLRPGDFDQLIARRTQHAFVETRALSTAETYTARLSIAAL